MAPDQDVDDRDAAVRAMLVAHAQRPAPGPRSLGRELAAEALHRNQRKAVTGEPLVAFKDYGKRRLLEPFDLAVRPGEVVGLAGLLGSGRTETAKLVFGIERADSGQAFVDGKPVLEYEQPQLDPSDKDAQALIDAQGGRKLLKGGTISLQSESHPIEFRKVEIMELKE